MKNLQIFIFTLIFLLIFTIYNMMEEQIKTGVGNAVSMVNNKLTVERSKINFKKKIDELKAYGVLEKIPKMAEPHYYILVHMAMGLIGALAVCVISPAFMVIGFIVGWFFLDYYFKKKSEDENAKMMTDIFAITSVITTQLKGGVYVGNALAECKDIVVNKRLKDALIEFHRHLMVEDMTFLEAVDDLSSKFDSPEMISLCMILRQNEETGRIKDIISDLARQISSTEEMIFEQTKAKTERSLTFAILIMFCDIMFFVMFTFIQNILAQF